MTTRTVGVEEEFLLVDRAGSGLAPVGDTVADDAAGSGHQVEHEFMQEQAETGSRPTTSLADLELDLHGLRARLADAADRHGALLLPSGTSPLPGRHHTTVETRYRAMTERFGPVAREQLVCGMHVHVGIDSPEQGVAVLDRIRPWLAVVLALSANSPLFAGADTGYHAYRSLLWNRWPTAGPAEPFGDLATYRSVTSALVGTGAALDGAMIYFDARLSARYPTVEIRVADVCARVEDAVTVAGLVRALVDTAAASDAPAPDARVDLLRAATWRAAHDGVAGELVDVLGGGTRPAWDQVEALVGYVGPSLEAAGDLDRVGAGLAAIRERGTGSVLQRAAFARGGPSAAVDAVLGVAG